MIWDARCLRQLTKGGNNCLGNTPVSIIRVWESLSCSLFHKQLGCSSLPDYDPKPAGRAQTC